MKKNKITVTYNDYQRLVGLIELSSMRGRLSEPVDKLFENLKTAKMLPQTSIENHIVTMNSEVLVREMNSGRAVKIQLTYPQDADGKASKASIFSPIGVELLGKKKGDVACWATPSGVGSFEIVDVVYQPEAAGAYHL